MKKILFPYLVVFCAVGVFADASELAVTNTRGVVRISPSDVSGIVAGTSHQTGYPSDVGDPIFWLDCADTNGWTIAADGKVSYIPSRIGERYLTTTKGNVSGFSWGVNSPVFDANDAVLEAPVLDFGTKGSLRVLMFNAVGPEGATTNMLEGIGTVVAVYYTAKGPGTNGEGGYYGGGLLGGGFGTNGGVAGNRSGYVLYRSSENTRRTASENSGDTGRQRYYDNPIVNPNHAHYTIQQGTVRQEGQVTQPAQVGFSGGWEIFSLVPNTTYGLFNASGFGMNYTDVKDVSGGFKVAEYLIYGRKLSEEETARVEDYLREKWFPSRAARGRNGDARIAWLRVNRNVSGAAAGVEMPVDVPEAEKLTIGRLAGGYGTTEAAIVKTGAGTLEIQDAANYNGVVKMNGGTLAFSRHPVPTTLPRDMVLHFDASAANSVVTNESGKVMVWRNLTDEVFRRETICGARPSSEANAPTLLPDELGTGLNVLDFGDLNSEAALNLSTNETEETVKTDIAVQCPVTLIAVVGAQRGGGRAIIGKSGANTPFDRYSGIPGHFTQRLIGDYSHRNSITASAYNTCFVDGLEVNGASDGQGYLTPGYQVVAIRTPGSPNVCQIGAGSSCTGGFRISELAVWRRVLTDDEIRDASAMLMKKWLKRDAPGYDRTRTDGVADLQKVTAVADTVIDVPEGTARIGTLASAGGRIVKTGAGTLEVQEFATGGIAVEGGKVVQVAKPDVCEDHKLDDSSWLAAAPSLHLDAADQSSMMIREVNGERRVVAWHSDDKGILATPPYGANASLYDYSMDSRAPFLNAEVTHAGHATVDFGPYTAAAGGRRMALSRSLDSVRHAYVVWAPTDGTRGVVLGSGKSSIDGASGELYNFLRSETEPAALIYNNGTSDIVRNGKIYTNGVQVSSSIAPLADVFTLTEYHTTGGAHVSMLGIDRDVERLSGGFRVAEIVLYERVLTEREQLATRNYLMAKWFGQEPVALPEAAAPSSNLTEIMVDGETELQTDGGIEAIRVVGEGTLTKAGDGTLTVSDMSAFTGTVSVAAGTVGVSGKRLPASGALVTEGLVFRVDANEGLTTTTNAAGVISVDKWESTLGDGWSAEPYDAAKRPTLIVSDTSLGGHQAVNLASMQAMKFFKDGEWAVLDEMHTVFWVLGSQDGGGFLLGGGTNWEDKAHNYNFMRERVGHSNQYFLPGDYILPGSSYWTVPEEIRHADWRMDGTNITATATGLSGAWDLITMTIPDDKHAANAQGFAFAGGGWNGEASRGRQRLAEVLVYDRALGAEERESVENYLRAKWGVYGYQAKPTNAASVALAAGTTFDLGGNAQYVAGLSGAGTVSNGVLTVGTLVADRADALHPEFDASASLAIGPGQHVLVSGAGPITSSTTITVMEGTVTGTENLSSAVAEIADGACPSSLAARLRYVNGVLFVKFTSMGLSISLH